MILVAVIIFIEFWADHNILDRQRQVQNPFEFLEILLSVKDNNN